jgi:hypothetical protein
LCCIASQHPISTLRAVARSSGGGCCCRHRLSLVPLSLSSPVHTSLPPYELLIAEGSGAVGVAVSPLSLLSSCPALMVLVLVPLALVLATSSLSRLLPSPFLLMIIVEMATGPLAPDPPCEQGLAVVGAGAGVLSYPPCLYAPGIVLELHP